MDGDDGRWPPDIGGPPHLDEPLPAFPTSWFTLSFLPLLGNGPLLLRGLLHTAVRAVSAVDEMIDLVDRGDQLLRQLQQLVEKLDRLVTSAQAMIDGTDREELLARVSRVEEAIINTEIATIHLDKTFEGSIETLPNIFSRRARRESQKIDPTRPPDA